MGDGNRVMRDGKTKTKQPLIIWVMANLINCPKENK